jgi:hypothetical protein
VTPCAASGAAAQMAAAQSLRTARAVASIVRRGETLEADRQRPQAVWTCDEVGSAM